jgi:hypothetical protein
MVVNGMGGVGQLACMWMVRSAIQILAGKAEERDESRNEWVIRHDVL